MYKKRKLRVLLRFFSILFLVLFLIFSAIHLYLGQTLRTVEDQYMEETAILYVKTGKSSPSVWNFSRWPTICGISSPAFPKASAPGTADTTTCCSWPATSSAA